MTLRLWTASGGGGAIGIYATCAEAQRACVDWASGMYEDGIASIPWREMSPDVFACDGCVVEAFNVRNVSAQNKVNDFGLA